MLWFHVISAQLAGKCGLGGVGGGFRRVWDCMQDEERKLLRMLIHEWQQSESVPLYQKTFFAYGGSGQKAKSKLHIPFEDGSPDLIDMQRQ